ncbi:MAG: glycosyltransferase family 39 protein [Candidatus Marsarchaeota archaeon]|nr:glycosyltransferase family 39 protein [Candidatus Marsarchaeota archaeon]
MKPVRTTQLLLLLILVLAFTLSYVFYAGPFYSFDDHLYLGYAHQVLSGTFNPGETQYAYGFLFPIAIAASFLAFGIGPLSAVIPTFMAFIALILLTFLLGRELYSENLGLLAAFFVVTAPFVIEYTTRVLPDMAIGAVATMSIYVLAIAHKNESEKSRYFYLIAGGLAMLTIYFKLIGLAFALFFFLAALLSTYLRFNLKKDLFIKQRSKVIVSRTGLAFLTIGIIAVGIIYLSAFYFSTGNPLGELSSYGEHQNAISPTNLSSNIGTLGITFSIVAAPNFGVQLASIPDPQVYSMGFLLIFALIATFIGIKRKDANVAFLSIIFWGFFLYLFFGSVTISAYHMITVITRYFIAVAAPLSILAAYFVLSIGNVFAVAFKKTGFAVIVLVFVAILLYANLQIYGSIYYYNKAISGDSTVMSYAVSYFNTIQTKSDLLINDNNSYEYMNFLSENGNAQYVPNMSVLQIYHTNTLKSQIANACLTNNAYMMVVVDNFTTNNYDILSSPIVWPKNCSPIRVAVFNDTAAASNTPQGQFLINATLYKISNN